MLLVVDSCYSADNYTVEKVFQPIQGRTRHSAKSVFKNFETKMAIIRNCRKFKDLDKNDPIRAIFVKFDDPPLTQAENKRLSDKLKRLRDEAGSEAVTYKITKGKLLRDGVQIDEFNLINQIFQ